MLLVCDRCRAFEVNTSYIPFATCCPHVQAWTLHLRVVPFRCSNLTAGILTMLFSLSKACPPAFPGSFTCSSCLAARKYRAASDVWFGTSKIWASLLLLAARASPYLRPGGTAYRSHRDQCHCHSMGHLLADAA